ncbi:MAG: ABC transporter substrate-binding protein [Nitriliruptoraceae bacterium]
MSGPGPGRGPGAAAVERALAGLPSPASLVTDEQLASLDTLETATLRELRAACETAEEGVSYARRVLQGRLDILRASLVERDDDGSGDLLDALPSILADVGPHTGPSRARSSRVRVPDDAERYTAAVDELLAEPLLHGLEEQPLDEADRLVELLLELEAALSARRRALFERIDALRAELAARYKDGRADVRDLLG